MLPTHNRTYNTIKHTTHDTPLNHTTLHYTTLHRERVEDDYERRMDILMELGTYLSMRVRAVCVLYALFLTPQSLDCM
jgi:hypothetical protein